MLNLSGIKSKLCIKFGSITVGQKISLQYVFVVVI